MAYLTGEGAMTNVNLLVKTYDNAVTKNGKTQFLDVMVDHRDQRGPNQTNLHLVSKKQELDGKTRYNNGAGYTVEQFGKIKTAAGPNVEPVTNQAGEAIGSVYAIKASVMPNRDGLIINTNKEIGQSDFKVEGDTLDNAFASMKAAKGDAQLARQTEANAAEVAKTDGVDVQIAAAEQTQASEPEPSIG